jgi:hypothetical protein
MPSVLHAQSGLARSSACYDCEEKLKQMLSSKCGINIPSFRMFDHLFMDARASKQFRALQTDFINP